MSGNRILSVALLLLLTGCETAAPTDAVRDESAAIESAKKICGWTTVRDGQSWHAKLRHGIWHVWFNADYRSDENEAIDSLEIRASDGFSNGCPVGVNPWSETQKMGTVG